MGFLGPKLPQIIVGEADRHDLLVLAMGGSGHTADAADDLLYELGRAKVVDDRRVPSHVVRMGSTIAVREDGGDVRVVRLAYPGEEGRHDVSILSPLGTALLGLRPGQTMRWTDRDGIKRRVAVLAVREPASAGPVSS
jgi:regulator of nucleoside diphosphate kinase